jgi:biopolymer transport protein ExbB
MLTLIKGNFMSGTLSRFTLVLLVLVGFLFSTNSSYAFQDAAPPAAEKKDEGDKPAAGNPSLFMHILKSAGWVFGPMILAISIALIALVCLLAMELRMATSIPPNFVEEFTDLVNKKQFKQAFDIAKEDGSFLGRVMSQGMSRLQYGIEDARESAYNMVDSIKASKEVAITYLSTIGTLGPLIGLVGTVFGMILSFMELGRPGSTPRPDKLADGISHALVVTLLGIGLSVPAIFFHAFYRNRLIKISMDTSLIADDLLTQMYHSTKKAAGQPGAPATPAAPNVPTKSVPQV